MTRSKGRTVVKLGGSLLEDGTLRGRALRAIASRFASGDRLVLVHGGGKRIDAFLSRMGIERRVHQGLRVTDEETLEVVVAVLAGLVNKTIVGELRALGVKAAGLAGVDAGTLVAEPHPPLAGIELGHVGRIVSCDPELLRSILASGTLPVVASVATDARGMLLNVNADAAASFLASALGARRLVYFTDVEGLLDEEGRLVERVRQSRARALLTTDAVTGGMKPKLLACLEAIAAGVPEVVIAGPSRHASVLRGGKGGTSLVAA
jgi:acetylglutamate kinase